MPVAQRHIHAAKKVTPLPEPTAEYVILDDDHRPDLHGHFAGQKVYWNNGKQCVRLTRTQAQFYLASASIQLAETVLKAVAAKK